jgi:ATPase family protein associated with various cellular activities (AAA)/uncharacterized protein DUF5925
LVHRSCASPDCAQCEFGADGIGETPGVMVPADFPVPVPYAVSVSRASDMLEAIFTAYLARLPFGSAQAYKEVKAGHGFTLPGSLAARRMAGSDGNAEELFRGVLEGAEWIAHVDYYGKNKMVSASVAAATMEVAERVQGLIGEGLPREPVVDDPNVTVVNHWTRARHGGFERVARKIDVFPWADIAVNYPQVDLGRLVALQPEHIKGKLLLIYGPPGTGKTNLLRAISTEWRGWCSFELVRDPEALLSNSDYLDEVLFGDYGSDNGKWHLVVLEDTGELLGPDAKAVTGQMLSRLLNVTDGILGQGSKVLVVVTTNEALADIHEAVVRPGRYLAQVEIGRFSYRQARTWMAGAVELKPREYTLGELYHLRDGEELPPVKERSTGQFL